MAAKTLKAIYSFSDFRIYLDHYCVYQKEVYGLTKRDLAKKAGLGSENYFQLVITGRRNLTIENIHQFARAMDLSLAELRYFELLVLENQAKAQAVKLYYSDQLKTHKRRHLLGKARAKLPEILSSWYFPAIISVLLGRKDGITLDEIVHVTGLSLFKVEDVINVLKRRSLVHISADSRIQLDDGYLTFDSGNHFHFDRFQTEQIRRSLAALKHRKNNQAKFYALTFTAGKGQLPKFTEMIKQFAEEVVEEANECPVEEVIQLNIQLFPFKNDAEKL